MVTRPYLAMLSDGTVARLVAVSRAAASLTARELYGAALVRVVEDGDW